MLCVAWIAVVGTFSIWSPSGSAAEVPWCDCGFTNCMHVEQFFEEFQKTLMVDTHLRGIQKRHGTPSTNFILRPTKEQLIDKRDRKLRISVRQPL